MKKILILLVLSFPLVHCASSSTPKNNTINIQMPATTPDYSVMRRNTSVSMNDDQLELEVYLLIPEVEIPRTDVALQQAYKSIQDLREKNGEKPISINLGSYTTESHRRICFGLKISSAKQKSYFDSKWTYVAKIDQKTARLVVTPKKSMVTTPSGARDFDPQNGTLVDVCTEALYVKGERTLEKDERIYVKFDHVKLTLKNGGAQFAQFEWHKPWPQMNQ